MVFENKPPLWFWVITVLALVWNGLGVFAYVMEVFRTPEALAELSALDRNLLDSRPSWVVAAFATAVHAAFVGCLFLLMRNRLATALFVISLLAVIVQNYYYFVVIKAFDIYPAERIVMPLMIIVVAIFLPIFSAKARSKNWLK